MVVKGNFSVCLLEAETKQAFKEHSKGGKHYAEVEPGVEYLIQVEVLKNNQYPSKDDERFLAIFYVDGTCLGYNQRFKTSGSHAHFFGAREYHNGVSTKRALRFNRPTFFVDSNSNPLATGVPLMGTVSVKFWQATYEGKRTKKIFSMSQSLSCEIAPPSGGGGIPEKVVRSEEGLWSQSKKTSAVSRKYTKDKHLETITIQYCTTLGLIEVGILPKPPLWERARMAAPHKNSMDPKLARIKPKRLKRAANIEDGVVLSQAMEWDLFDLTHLDSDSDADDSDGVAEDSDNEDNNAPLDLTGMLKDGELAAPKGVERQVDGFFIERFHGKPYDNFHQGYRRKVALRETAKRRNIKSMEYEQIVKRHEAWEAAISTLHFQQS